ncbi:hypothetical protein [Azospirillum picis]|uniref:DUF4148 domain-containing protein n=1 Tax=Azospirillum picis TaxID=488438 RepID=A0ABU0MQ79_9PROT|nr:hypothetical protein [Azospirillum picis]MBP2302076.1 hypothetical protein [Azospirillum picis]MDQ0535633.1 hypothetical protein [Azospirillum picis]
MQKRILFISMLATSASLSAVAQEVSVPPVTTADPGYLFPNDQYQRGRQEKDRDRSRSGRSQSGQTGMIELDAAARARVEASIKALVPEYNRRAKRDGEVKANAWIRQKAFVLGQREADLMKERMKRQ